MNTPDSDDSDTGFIKWLRMNPWQPKKPENDAEKEACEGWSGSSAMATCNNLHITQRITYQCTRHFGHPGYHVAAGDGGVFSAWGFEEDFL